MFVFAQLSTSVSDDQIRLIIIALLVVAVLLAALTVWYFVKTSPTRRVRAAQARRQAGGQGRPVAGAATATAERAATRPNQIIDDARDGAGGAANHADDDAEWERLTAPEPRRPASS